VVSKHTKGNAGISACWSLVKSKHSSIKMLESTLQPYD